MALDENSDNTDSGQDTEKRLLADLRPLRESPDFRRLWVGQTISTTGNMITGVVVPVQTYSLTHSSLMVGLIGLAEAAPTIALGLFGGSIADAVDRRKLVLVTSLLSVVVSAVFAVQAMLDLRQLWLLFVLVTLQSCLFALNVPASRTFMPFLLPPERYAAAAALQQMSFQASIVIGPLLAGVVIASAGASTAYAIDAVSFLFAAYAALRLRAMPVDKEAAPPGLSSVVKGLRFVRNQPAIRSILLLDLNNMVFGMPLSLIPAFAEEQFHGGPQTVGLLYAAPALGGVIGATVSGPLSRVRRQGRAVLVASAVWGLAVVAFGLTPWLWLAVPVLAVAGAADMVNGVFRSTILHTHTPDALRGRVNSVGFVVGEAGPHLGNAEAGAVGSLTSLRFSAVSGGLACVVGILLIAVTSPTLIRQTSDPNPAGAASREAAGAGTGKTTEAAETEAAAEAGRQ
ncbi:MFS transporter [Streptomyces sp. LZ34]